MTNLFEITVAGTPIPQGSKRSVGKFMIEANPRTRPWRSAVSHEALTAWEGKELLDEPLFLLVDFYFARPKSHYRTGKNAHMLKEDAPHFHAGKPDADKLLRAIGDSLTGIVVRDDSRFVQVNAVKLYGQERAVIRIVRATNHRNPNGGDTQ